MNITLFKAAKKLGGILVWAVWTPRRASAQRRRRSACARAKTVTFKRTEAKMFYIYLQQTSFVAFSVFILPPPWRCSSRGAAEELDNSSLYLIFFLRNINVKRNFSSAGISPGQSMQIQIMNVTSQLFFHM